MHWGGYTNGDPHKNSQGYDYAPGTIDTSTGLHTYGFEWNPYTVNWYVDGVLRQTQTNRCDKPMYMIINLALGGGWPGNPDATTPFPANLKVDYVRVYSNDPGILPTTAQAGYAPSLPASIGTVDAPGTTYPLLNNGSFETTFTSNNYTANTTGTPWTFTGTSGIIANGTGAYNVIAAADGFQSAMIDRTGLISQTFTVPASDAGTYALSFKAVNRTFSTNDFKVQIDGVDLASYNPAATGVYAAFTTPTFNLTAGSHTVSSIGNQTSTGRVCFIDDVNLGAVTANGLAIGAPTNLTVVPGAVEGSTVLTWTNATVINAAGYIIERKKTATGNYAIIAQVDGATSSYTDADINTEANNAGNAYYRVAAITAGGAYSAFTNEANAAVPVSPLAAPTGLKHTLTGRFVNLTWLNHSYYSCNLLVERATNPAGPFTQIATPTTTNYYTDQSSVSGTTYYYRVRVQGVIIGTGNTTTTAYSDYSSVLTVPVNVTKVTPTLAWTAPAAITYGTALGATQLNANANVPGTFAYTPAAGTVLAAGSQNLSVLFTPTDTVNYTAAAKSVTLQVNSNAAPVINWAAPAAITYGTALSATPFNATANIPGVFAYTPAVGAVLNAGSQTLSVLFTPTDVSQAATTKTVSLTVNKASTTTVSNNASATYGAATVALTAKVTSSTATVNQGTVTFTVKSGTTTIATLTSGTVAGGVATATLSLIGRKAVSYTVSAVYTPGTNFLASTAAAAGTLTISKATPTFLTLAAPTVAKGTALATMSGTIKFGTLIPTGKVKMIFMGGSKSITIGANGTFSTTFKTSSLAKGTYTITYQYLGDTNFNTITATTLLTVI